MQALRPDVLGHVGQSCGPASGKTDSPWAAWDSLDSLGNSLSTRRLLGPPALTLRVARHLAYSSLEIATLNFSWRQFNGAAISDLGVKVAPEAAKQVGTGCSEQVVVGEGAASFQFINKAKADCGTVGHGDRNSPVEGDHRGGRDSLEPAVERRDFDPVRLISAGCRRVAGGDGCQQLVRPVVNHDRKRQHLSEKKMVENGST
jgi:hypothetical protein